MTRVKVSHSGVPGVNSVVVVFVLFVHDPMTEEEYDRPYPDVM